MLLSFGDLVERWPLHTAAETAVKMIAAVILRFQKKKDL